MVAERETYVALAGQTTINCSVAEFGTLSGLPRFARKVEQARTPMALFLSGVCGAAFLTLGIDPVLPLGATLSGLCDLIGLASAVFFVGLMDGR